MMPVRRTGCFCLALLALLVLQACVDDSATLRWHTQAYRQVDTGALRAVVAAEAGLDLVPGRAEPGSDPLAALANGSADLAIVDNTTPFQAGSRTVIPLYRSVLHLLLREGVSLAAKRRAGEPLSIYIVNDSHAGHTFVQLASERASLLAGRVRLESQLEPGVTDAIVYFGPIAPQHTPWFQPGYRLVSPADAGEAAAEFLREGVTLLVPQMHAMEIPALTYSLPGNERALPTLSVSTLLVARKQADASRIYELTRSLVEQRAQFAALEPDIFSWVSEHFDREQLNFPLHEGARQYLDRDAPTLLERYAESISLVVYLAILCATGMVAFFRWRVQRRKDRIDTFYSRLLVISERNGHEPAGPLLEEARALELEAYRLLVEEKLAADESFRIFTDLLATVRAKLQD